MKGSDELPITPEDKAQASTKGRPVKGSDLGRVLGDLADLGPQRRAAR